MYEGMSVLAKVNVSRCSIYKHDWIYVYSSIKSRSKEVRKIDRF